MRIVNTGKDSFENDLAEAFEGLQQQRTTLLAAAIDAQLGLRQLADLEARRLEAKRGSSDPRLAILGDRADALLARVTALGVERDIASIRTPPVAKAGTLVHGRIVDANLQPAGRVTVRLVDEKGKDLAGVAPVEADDSGYYAFSVPPETVVAVGATAKLSIVLRSGTDQLAPAAARPFTIAPGAATVQEVALGTAELEKLKLRLPTTDAPAPDKPPGKPGTKAKDSKSK
jgi:hypothetical protein